MESLEGWTAAPTALRALADHLQLIRSKLSEEQALTLAIDEWKAEHSEPDSACGDEILRGYQWKSLFLPESTALRMIYGGNSYYAQVVGDHLVYAGRKVSPREMTMAISSSVRNAWRELSIRFPGTRSWKNAHTCRIEQAKRAQAPRVSPSESLAATAAAMSEALKSALLLMEQSSMQAAKLCERRIAQPRRDSDRQGDDDYRYH